MSSQNIPSNLSAVNPELWPRGIWREIDRPFSELQAEAAARRASWYRSDDKPKIVNRAFVVPVMSTDFIDNLLRVIEALDRDLTNLQQRLVIDDTWFKRIYARSA